MKKPLDLVSQPGHQLTDASDVTTLDDSSGFLQSLADSTTDDIINEIVRLIISSFNQTKFLSLVIEPQRPRICLPFGEIIRPNVFL